MGKYLSMKSTAALALLILAAAVFAPACADEPAGTTPPATTNNDPVNNNPVNNNPNNSVNNAVNNNPVPGKGRLEHVTSQSESMNANSTLMLKVRHKDANGQNVANSVIRWEIVGQSEGTALAATQSVTQSDGVATADLFSANREAFFDVKASVADDPEVDPIVFRISVRSKEFASYNVVADYQGSRPFTTNNVTVFLFPNTMTCAQLDYHVLLSAERSETRPRDAAGFPMRYVFTNLNNGSSYTAFAVAYADGNDKVIGAWGCNDDRPVIAEGNDPEDIVIEMQDNVPVISGRWNVTSRFDLSQAVPENVAQYLNPILDFFVDPAGTVVTLAADYIMEEFGISLGAFQGLVEDIVGVLLDQAINSNQTVSQVFTAAGDVSEILRNFQLQGQLTVNPNQVDPSGAITGGLIEYFTFGYRWRLACDPGEFEENPSCGDNYVSFNDADVQPLIGTFNGAVIPNPNYSPNQGRIWYHELAIEDHPVDFNYGQIILYLIEKLALPYLFQNNANGCIIDSLESLLACYVQCDEIFPDSNTFESICEVLLTELSGIATDFLTEQSLSYENFTFGTPADNACALYEKADNEYGAPTPPARFHDPQFKEMGKEQTHPQAGDLRCDWDVKIQFSADPTDRIQLPGYWTGVKTLDR